MRLAPHTFWLGSSAVIVMIPALRGLMRRTATPLAWELADLRTPAPETTTLTPCMRLEPAVTRTETLSGLPSALIICGETASARQKVGGVGFPTGGLRGAGTRVTAEATLSAGF